MAGCEGGFGSGFAWKNPFAGISNPFSEISNPFSKANSESALADNDAPPRRADDLKSPLEASYREQLARARSFQKAGKYDEARQICQRLITSRPDRYEAYHTLGVVADFQRRYHEAQSLYEQALNLDRGNPEILNDLGYCYMLQGQLDKAERALKKAVAASPSNTKWRNNLGIVYGRMGRDREAFEQFRRAGSDADAYYNLASIKASREDLDGAKQCLRMALATDPNYEKARRLLKSFAEYEQDPEGVMDNGPMVADGRPWVPFDEQKYQETAEAVPASHNMAVHPDHRSLLRQTRQAASQEMDQPRYQ